MPRYKGRRSTIELYKKEKERVTGIVKRLEAKGVIVPESIINKQAGDKIIMKDVKRLQSMTRESIVKRSQVEVYSLDHLDVTVQTVTGKQAVRELKKQGVRSRKAKREEKTDVVSRYYIDIEEGFKIDLRNGKVIGRATKKEIESAKRIREDARRWSDEVSSYSPEEDYDWQPYSTNRPRTDFQLEFLSRYLKDLGMYTMDTDDLISTKSAFVKNTARNANSIDEYVTEAIRQYGTEGVARVLEQLASDGYEITPKMLYDDEKVSSYLSRLDRALPLDNRYDFEMSRNDEEDSAEEEDE